MLSLNKFDYEYPSDLVATVPAPISRIMYKKEGEDPQEISWPSLLGNLKPEDLLVVNDTQVFKARVTAQNVNNFEILFIERLEPGVWKILCRSKKWPKIGTVNLPGDLSLKLVNKGSTQLVRLSREIEMDYFDQYGDMPIPPYILKARHKERNLITDNNDYQSVFAKNIGSIAAPTASLHFTENHIDTLKQRGVTVASLTLHVGIGTFLPIKVDDLDEHKMHSEWVSVPKNLIEQLSQCKKNGGRVWCLGTTSARALEAYANGHLNESENNFSGETDLFIKPGYKFKAIDVLLTNFHQPKSSLLSMVSAFSTRESVMSAYQWAIGRSFRLFSYGDLSVWEK